MNLSFLVQWFVLTKQKMKMTSTDYTLVDKWLLQHLLSCSESGTVKKNVYMLFLIQHKSVALCADNNSWRERSGSVRTLLMRLIRILWKEQLNINYQLQTKSSMLQMTSLDIYTKSKTQIHALSLFMSHIIWWFMLNISAPCCFILSTTW